MDVPCEMLLHPELLSNEQLSYIIQMRHIKVSPLERMSRGDLLQLFHQYCVPYGQRKYRDSGRGKILNKARQMSPETTPRLHTMQNQNTQSRKEPYRSNNNRIKPPPDLLSGHMKRIKLETQSSLDKDSNNIKRKMSVDANSPIAESPPAKKDKKPITWP